MDKDTEIVIDDLYDNFNTLKSKLRRIEELVEELKKNYKKQEERLNIHFEKEEN